MLKKAKGNKDREKLRLEIERLLGKDKKPIKNKSKVLPLIRKHFPNMFMKRVIIPAKDLLEDSSNVVTEVGPTTSSTQFMRKLDTLMKDLRGVQAKKVAPPKPVRKFPPPRPRNPKPAELNRQLSKADKEELKNSTIFHLPLDKQKEYKQLLLLVKQKENAHLASKKSASSKVKALPVKAKPVMIQEEKGDHVTHD